MADKSSIQNIKPAFKTTKSWEELLDNTDFVSVFLSDVLEDYITKQRWYGGKSSKLKYIELAEFFKIQQKEEVYYGLILEVNFIEAFYQHYFLPIAFVTDDHFAQKDKILPIEIEGNKGYIIDAINLEAFRKLVFQRIASAEPIDTTKVQYHKSHLFENKTYKSSRFMGLEQSNTSLVYNEKYILKFFRRIFADKNPDYENPLHVQVARSIMRGDVTQSSFAFTVKEYSWGKSDKYGDNSMHIVRKIDQLLDVSPVTYPAYEETLAQARSILRTKPDSYTDYPEAASNNAQRALDWAEENGWGDCGTDVGKARARQLASKSPISRDVIAKMAAFKRHEQHKDVPYSEGCGGLMWDAWGGDAGIEWAQRKLKEIDKDKRFVNESDLINIIKLKHK